MWGREQSYTTDNNYTNGFLLDVIIWRCQIISFAARPIVPSVLPHCPASNKLHPVALHDVWCWSVYSWVEYTDNMSVTASTIETTWTFRACNEISKSILDEEDEIYKGNMIATEKNISTEPLADITFVTAVVNRANIDSIWKMAFFNQHCKYSQFYVSSLRQWKSKVT